MSKGMEIILARDRIRSVLARYKDRYPEREFRFWGGMTAGEVQDRLEALNLETCSSQDVDNVMIGSGWADNDCDFCDRNVPALIRLGDTPDYETRWVDICPDCLKEAIVSLELVAP